MDVANQPFSAFGRLDHRQMAACPPRSFREKVRAGARASLVVSE